MNDITTSPNGIATRTERFAALHDACRQLIGDRVTVLIGDNSSGFGFAAFTGTVSGVNLEDNRAELRLDDGTRWLALFDDMVDGFYADADGIEIEYTAGNVSITRLSA